MDPIQSEAQLQVRPIGNFKGVREDGSVVEGIKPYGTTFSQDTKYYKLQIPNGSMFRPDGMRIGFVEGMYETKVEQTQNYLDEEIANNHPYVREANEDEVRVYKLKKDPKAYYTKEIAGDLEDKLRAEFQAKIDAILNAGVGTPEAANIDSVKLAGLESLKDKLSTGIKSGTGTIIMKSEAAPLKGIVGSDQLAGGAAGSSSGTSL